MELNVRHSVLLSRYIEPLEMCPCCYSCLLTTQLNDAMSQPATLKKRRLQDSVVIAALVLYGVQEP
jgi:hypothetical protein